MEKITQKIAEIRRNARFLAPMGGGVTCQQDEKSCLASVFNALFFVSFNKIKNVALIESKNKVCKNIKFNSNFVFDNSLNIVKGGML